MIITEDGNHKLNMLGISKKNTGSSVVYVNGSLGGGTGTLSYADDFGTIVPLLDGLVAVGGQYQINHGSDIPIYLVLAGSTGASLSVKATGKK